MRQTTSGSQAVTGTQEQDAFGREVSTTGSTSIPYGFHGSEGYRNDRDGPSGLDPYQRVGARYYDRLTGRFITRDTDLTQSPYAYCNGDPVNNCDPSGHINIASPGVSTINGPAGTGTGILDLPGNASDDDSDIKNPYPGVGGDQPSGIRGSVTSSGLTSTASLTFQDGVGLTAVENNGNLTSVGDSGSISLFGGLSATFGEMLNLSMPAGNSSSLGLNFMSGNVSLSGSTSSSGVTTLKVTDHF